MFVKCLQIIRAIVRGKTYNLQTLSSKNVCKSTIYNDFTVTGRPT